MLPYPFSYFANIWGFRRPFANRKSFSWFQLFFTSVFLIALMLIPLSIQHADRTSYPLTTFIEEVFEPLTDDVLQDFVQHTEIANHQLHYTGNSGKHTSPAGDVHIGKENTQLGQNLTLAFEPEQLIISQAGKRLANLSYQAIDNQAIKSKESLVEAINQDWFQQNRLTVSLFLMGLSAFLLSLNFFIIVFGATFFLYLTKKSKLFSFQTVKECYHFTLNCLGVPTLIALILGLLGQPMTTMVTCQNILFVLYLVILFYKTQFRDEKSGH
ncbi:DUF1189 domain-containing protein [Streptococcus himalayensis]|uniref:Maltodextrose utilization protein MalA n=1 Tax=Streptococcus himalayensis TaxID=1888195 RepID=A0A917A2N3_9STRE|nr:DUF1189 domain-containing protein [Streptococcus himalayensis]GGE23349.1 maltodextrose utilization protein MalA [Streptococcus himalayensis]